MDYALDLKRFLCIFRFMVKRTVEEQILRTISFLESGRVFSSTDFADIANQTQSEFGVKASYIWQRKSTLLGILYIISESAQKNFPMDIGQNINPLPMP